MIERLKIVGNVCVAIIIIAWVLWVSLSVKVSNNHINNDYYQNQIDSLAKNSGITEITITDNKKSVVFYRNYDSTR